MLLHAKHGSRDAQRVVIQSPDTDMLLLCVTHNDEIECDELWFRTGVKDRLRYIPTHKIAAGVGPLMCKGLPAFHALTRCDSTSALSRVGKKKAWKIIVNSKVHQQHCVGQSPDVDSVTARKAEAFICGLYNVSNRIPTSADEACYVLFRQKAQSNLQLPPTSDSLLQHIKRANYQVYVWRKALVPRQDLPTPAGNGWTIQGNSLFPQLMTKPPAPESILELVNCQCSSLRARRNVAAVIMDWPAPKRVSAWLMKTAITPTRPVITIQTTTMICQSIIRFVLDTIKVEHIFPFNLSNLFIDTYF